MRPADHGTVLFLGHIRNQRSAVRLTKLLRIVLGLKRGRVLYVGFDADGFVIDVAPA